MYVIIFEIFVKEYHYFLLYYRYYNADPTNADPANDSFYSFI